MAKPVSIWRLGERSYIIKKLLSEQSKGYPNMRKYEHYVKLYKKNTFQSNRPRRYTRTVSPEEISIIRELDSAGINVDKIVSNPNSSRVTFENGGPTIAELSNKGYSKNKLAKMLLTELPDMIYAMHSRGIFHGHPHFRNITYDGKKLRIIDFSLAKRLGRIFVSTKRGLRVKKVIDWSNEQLYSAFYRDYHFLYEGVSKVLGVDQATQFAYNLIQKYPFSLDIKRALLTGPNL